jgi:D-glycero-D-manno-heptose 1,7-bisphosphate phosphatase
MSLPFVAERPAAFLDRDGVINEERNYVYRIEDFRFLPGALQACRSFVEAGYLLVIVTNQAGIARGYYDTGAFETLTRWMEARFAEAGAPLAAVYHCPHHPDAKIERLRLACDCRKPAPGLILQAQRDLGIDLRRSFLVGDKVSDIEAGRAAGVGRCFLLTDLRSPQETPQLASADAVAGSLAEVAELIRRADFMPSPGQPNRSHPGSGQKG